MIFKGPGGFGRIVNILMCTIMCIVLSLIILTIIQNIPGNEALPILTPLGFAVSFVMSFAVGFVVADILPLLTWGHKLCAAIGIKNKVVVHFISCFILAFGLITCVSIACVWITNVQTLGLDASIAIWTMVYPPMLGVGYVVILITLPLMMKIATAISGFNPQEAPAPDPQGKAQGKAA